MKLITKTILYYLLISLPLIVIAGFLSYYLIRSELHEGTNEMLYKESIQAKAFIKAMATDSIFYLSDDKLSNIKRIYKTTIGYKICDSTLFDSNENELVNYRIITHNFYIDKTYYSITIAKPTISEDELLEGLFTSFALIIVFLLLSFFLVNFLLAKTLWKPFYKTLNQLNNYDIKQHKAELFEPSTIIEFQNLNNSLNVMNEKNYKDYTLQKEFTENAAHEMQTPLAVIKANIGLLVQSPHLKEEEMNHLQTIDTTANKLSALNKTLLLLAKIDSNQFNQTESINLAETILKVLQNYNDALQAKQIKVLNTTQEKLVVNINQTMADILITNLIQNAIRHNVTNGTIEISLTTKCLLISNSGKPLSVNENDLFLRFKKDDASKDSLGLGLAIVKSICDVFQFKIDYTYINNLHIFKIQF